MIRCMTVDAALYPHIRCRKIIMPWSGSGSGVMISESLLQHSDFTGLYGNGDGEVHESRTLLLHLKTMFSIVTESAWISSTIFEDVQKRSRSLPCENTANRLGNVSFCNTQ